MKKRHLNKLILFFFCAFCFAQQHPSLEPLFLPEDVPVNADSTGTELSADEVFKLSLLFSECPPDSPQGQFCLEQFQKIKEEVTGQSFMSQSAEDRGRAILKLLYRNYLKTYEFTQTRLDVALTSGIYNCVSSALLYMAAAKAAGLTVRGQKTLEHAFCTVYIPGTKSGQYKKIDVETTNPYGFNPGSKETIENEDNIKRYYVVPKAYYSNRQEVTDTIFAGLIAGNLCAGYIEQDNYIDAVPLGAARYQLVRNEKSNAANQARNDFDVLAANYVNTDVRDAVSFDGIVEWYTSFIDRWGMTDFLQKNMDNAVYNLLVLCAQENNYEFAVASVQKYKAYISQNQYSKQFYNVFIVIIHNNFADQANNGNYDTALQILEDGLQQYPNDKTLKKDLSDLQKVMKNR